MRKFEKKIKELGFELGKLSGILNKEVAEFYQVEKELNELKEELQNANGGDVESIENEIREGEEALLDFDEMLEESVETYAKNKPAYDEKVRRMTEGREKKKLAKIESNATPPPPPTSSFYVSKCDDTAQLTFDFTSSLSMSIGNVFTLPSAYALEGCWYVSSSYSGATDLSNVSISQSFVDCATCETPPSSSYLVINCENTSSTYYVTFFDDIIPANVFTSTTGSLSGSCWSVSGSASVAPAISDVGVLANYANCSYCLGVPVEYQIDNAASGDSASACSGATTTSIVYADPGYTVPFVSMILYDSAALTTPFIGSTGWRKLTGPLDVYAVEITVIGEITNYVTCP